MTTVERRIAGPERPGGQGLDPNQEESGNRAIIALLTDPKHGDLTDIVATYRFASLPDENGNNVPPEGAYEVWSRRGMIRFQRFIDPAGGYGYEVIEQSGQNPIANQDPTMLSTIAEELEAGAKSGNPDTDPNKAYVEPEHYSHPLAYERLAQLFDSPNAPDLVISPKAYAYGRQPGQHGALDVCQSRAPLVFSGPGITPGAKDAICAQVDVAPTLAKLLGMPLIDGMDSTGRTSSERGVEPDVYLKRQDGKPIDEILDVDASGQPRTRPERAYIMLLDGLSNTELKERLERDKESIPNLARIIEAGAMFTYGTTVNLPSITWPSHNALGSGAWCGHHDVVNPTYYLRESKETVTPQGMQFDTGRFVGPGVETFYEAVHRVFGKWDPSIPQGERNGALTVSINEPCMRGAQHSTLERRLLMDGEKVREISRLNKEDTCPRWKEDGQESVYRSSGVDIAGLAQMLILLGDDQLPAPKFTYQEFSVTDAVGHDYGPHGDAIFQAMIETDKRIGKILSVLDQQGLFDSTLFVVTTDHGMSPIKTELAADSVQAVLEAGLKAVVPAPLIYLVDMEVIVEPSNDGRTVTVTVQDNDADAHGDKKAVGGATVQVLAPHQRVVAETKTDAFGSCGLPLPVGENPEALVVSVHHGDFNPRHLRLDGTNVVEDIRERLFG